MNNQNDQSLAIPKENMIDIPQPGAEVPSIIPPTTNEMVTMMLRSAGTLEITDEQKGILFAPVDPDSVEIRPDGLIYLPAMEYREKLCQTFGVGWALLPAEVKPQREGNLIVWPHYLFIQGQPIALVYGEQEYRPNNYTMTYGDAIEGAASNALMRACKRININRELWRPSFIRSWKERYAEPYTVQRGRNKGKTEWRRKEIKADVEEPEDQGVSAEADNPETEAVQEGEEKTESADNDFWRRKAFQHAGDLGMTADDMTELCRQHIHQIDFETGDYLRDNAGERIPVTEKKQVHWGQWKKVAQHLYHTWDAAGKPEKAKAKEEERGDQEDPPETPADAPEQPDTQAEPEKPQDAPATQQEEDKSKRDELEVRFRAMAAERFPDPIERMAWIDSNVAPASGMDIWDPKIFENGIKLLTDGANDPKMTNETMDALRKALADFPDKKYKTMKSRAFREVAYAAIDHEFKLIEELTEKDGRMIVWKLQEEKTAIEQKVEQKVEQIRSALAGEDEEQEAQEPEQAAGAEWVDHELEKREESGTDADTLMSDERFGKMKELIEDMPERFRSIGSETVRDFIFETVKHGFKRIKDLTESEAGDVILAMQDVIDEENNNAAHAEMNLGE